MITAIRKHQKVLMIIITILVIIAFAWLYNSTDIEKLGANTVGRIYGRALTQTEIDRRARTFNLAASLGLFDLISGLGGQTGDRAQAIESFVINGIVLDHEAGELQIRPTNAQVAEVVRTLPVFQTNGKFDIQRYSQFIERTLAPNGFTEAQLEETVRSQLELGRIRDLLGAAAASSSDEVRAEWERRNRTYSVQVIRFAKEDFRAGIEVSGQEIEAYYEENKDGLTTPEERVVAAVRFRLADEVASLEGPERIKALQALADKAGEFTQAVLEPGATFEELAGQYGVTVEKFGPFTQGEPPEGIAEFAGAADAAFALSEEDPHSDAIQGGDGFLVLHLDSVVASRAMTIEEARPQIVTMLTDRKAREAMQTRAKEVVASIREKMAAGTAFEEAVGAVGLSAESLPAFSMSNPALDSPDAPVVFQAAIELPAGGTSDLLLTADGGVVVHVASTTLPDDAEFEKQKKEIAAMLTGMKRQIAYYQWLTTRVEAAGISGVNQ